MALTTGMHNGQRFTGSDSAAEIVLHESGRLVLASERAVTTRSFSNVFPPPPDATVVFEALIIGPVSCSLAWPGRYRNDGDTPAVDGSRSR